MKKRSLLGRYLDILIVFTIFIPFYYAHTLTQPISPFLPREDPIPDYTRYHHITWRPPFVMDYFLMIPDNYQPQKYSYPLIVLLHGASTHVYGGKALARSEMRAQFPAFVLIPIAPFGFIWATPERFSFKPQALSNAIDIVDAVSNTYNINKDQIYISGQSMGGVGVYAALERYHGVFAAAAPIAGVWDSSRVAGFDNIPIRIFHGARDTVISPDGDRMIANGLQNIGRDVGYTEIRNAGHDVWTRVYDSQKFWYWMLSQKKRR